MPETPPNKEQPMATDLTYIEDEKQRDMFKAFLEEDRKMPRSELAQATSGRFLLYGIEEMYMGWKAYAEYLKFLQAHEVVLGYALIGVGADGKKFVRSFSS